MEILMFGIGIKTIVVVVIIASWLIALKIINKALDK
jgi:hypothetical protein